MRIIYAFKEVCDTLSEEEEIECSISVEDKTITIIEEGKSYTMKYDLTNNPTFIYENIVEDGMDIEEYENQEK